MKLNPSLNSLRFICVFIVIFLHWDDDLNISAHLGTVFNYIGPVLRDAGLAVDMFFVISGFFITYGLLVTKQNPDPGFTNKTKILGFYVKRVFRIFPVYYLLLFILWIINYSQIRQNIAWLATYNSNHLMFKNKMGNSFGHSWSLSVEEQFYLVWPWIITYIPLKKLVPVILSLTLISMIFYVHFKSQDYWTMALLPACFFAFCLGGLLSILKMYHNNFKIQIDKVSTYILPALLVVKYLALIHKFNIPAVVWVGNNERVMNAILGFLIINKLDSRPMVLNFKPIAYLGQVSYGIYLYHYVLNLPQFVIQMLHNDPVLVFIIRLILVLLVSVISYEFLEKRLVKLGHTIAGKVYKKRSMAVAPIHD